MTFGLNPEDFKTFQTLVVNPLKRAGFKLYVFGSRVTGKNHPFSDIDVLLEPEASAQMNVLSDVKEKIEAARFPI